MTRLREILRDRKGNGFPLAIAITQALVIIFCGISEYIRPAGTSTAGADWA